MDLDQQTENLVWQLHRQLNDLRPRAGRAGAHALTTQLSLERARRGRAKQQGTESGSREHSRRRRSSDGGGGGGEQQHTSARRVKKEPIETSSSGDERRDHKAEQQQQHQQQPKKEPDRTKARGADSDHQERPTKRSKQQQQEQQAAAAAVDLQQLPAAAQAAVVASEEARRRAKSAAAAAVVADGDAPSKGDRTVKLFLAGMRWGVSLPCSALRSRHELARSVNDAFVGETLSVGRGDDLDIVFVSAEGDAEEMPAPRGGSGGGGGGGAGGRRGGESAAKWRRLVGKAARVYVRWQDGAGPGALGGGVATGRRVVAGGVGHGQALPMPHEELD